ncbi:MAG: hypothetical protein MPK31_04475 [Gammaproteobacteria bacterium]|nr:hypothetical protein [Gammaproteobacteria bacterium]
MKLQYLGDSKDAFKWDYLNFLAGELRSKTLHYVPMWTQNDSTRQGETDPKEFPAPENILAFCDALHKVRCSGNFVDACCKISDLPKMCSGGGYSLQVHKKDKKFRNAGRDDYFSDIDVASEQLLFVDPDIGFEPKKATAKHVGYSDIEKVWKRLESHAPDESWVVVVFQHSRRMDRSFHKHYEEIKARLSLPDSFDSTALFWCEKAMFVAIGSPARINAVRDANIKYQKQCRPVQNIE